MVRLRPSNARHFAGTAAISTILSLGCGGAAGNGSGAAAGPATPSATPQESAVDPARLASLRERFERGGKRCVPGLAAEVEHLLDGASPVGPGPDLLVATTIACEDWSALAHLLQRRAEHAPSATAWLELARIEAKGQRFEQSLAAIDAAIALDPTVDHQWLLGYARFHAGDAEGALKPLQALAASSDPKVRTDALELLGAALLQLGRADEALVPLDAALAADPQRGPAMHSRARALSKLGRLDESRDQSRRFEALQQEVGATGARRARLAIHSRDFQLALGRGDIAAAEAALRTLQELASDDERPQLTQFQAVLDQARVSAR